MDAELRPNRSLSYKAFRIMFIAVIAVNVVVAAVFVAQGAYPVAGFLGLDVLALYIAFRLNYRSGQALERVRIAPELVHVERRDPKGVSVHWGANPLWARVSADERSVLIRSGKLQLRVGGFLSPRERSEFTQALDDALWRAKNRKPVQKPSTSRIE